MKKHISGTFAEFLKASIFSVLAISVTAAPFSCVTETTPAARGIVADAYVFRASSDSFEGIFLAKTIESSIALAGGYCDFINPPGGARLSFEGTLSYEILDYESVDYEGSVELRKIKVDVTGLPPRGSKKGSVIVNFSIGDAIRMTMHPIYYAAVEAIGSIGASEGSVWVESMTYSPSTRTFEAVVALGN